MEPSQAAIGSLIPGLPDDVAIFCLAGVHWRDFKSVRATCRSWFQLLRSDHFISVRRQIGSQEEWLFVLAGNMTPETVRVEAFDPSQAPPACVPSIISVHPNAKRLWGCEVISHGVCLYVIGGSSGSPDHVTFSDMWRFNALTSSWSQMSSMAVSRYSFACGLLGDFIIVSGGFESGHQPLNSAELYDISNDSWHRLADMKEARAGCKGVVYDGHFTVFGGIGLRRGVDTVTTVTLVCSEVLTIEPGGEENGIIVYETTSEDDSSEEGPSSPPLASSEWPESTSSRTAVVSRWEKIQGTWRNITLPGSFAVRKGKLFGVADITSSLLEYSEEARTWHSVAELTPQKGYHLVALNGGLLLIGAHGGEWLEPQEREALNGHSREWSSLSELHNDILAVATMIM